MTVKKSIGCLQNNISKFCSVVLCSLGITADDHISYFWFFNYRPGQYLQEFYGLWSPHPPPYLEYKHAHCGYLHRLFCKVGVNRVNMKVFTLFAPSTLNVSKMEYTVKMGYIIINKLWWRRWSLSLWCKRFHGVKGKIISFGYQKLIEL